MDVVPAVDDLKLNACVMEISSCNEEKRTEWRSVALAGAVTFLAAVENTVVGMAEWPYMHTIDPEATSQFFGAAQSVSKCGHALFALIFSFWTYKKQNIRAPLIAGRIIAFIACCLYLSVEFLPEGRRYLMMICYLMFGIASSSSCVLRVYVVHVSAREDRARAYAAIVLANMISVVIGPVCQLAFTSVSYPGIEMFPSLRFHLYSAPIWIASSTNFVSIALIYFALGELPSCHTSKSKGFSIESLKSRLSALMALDVAWSLVLLCWLQKVVANLSVITLQTVASPLMMSSFGWDGEHTVKVMSMALGTVGVLSLSISFIYMATSFTKRFSPRASFLFALAISIFMYIFSYPYAWTSHKLPEYNVTTKAGCNPEEYDWCFSASATSPTVFIPIVVCVMGVGMPMAQISLDTIYSTILGNIDQTLLQGAIVVAEDIVLVLGPLYSAAMFSEFGQSTLWTANGIITVGGALLWLFYYRKLRNHR